MHNNSISLSKRILHYGATEVSQLEIQYVVRGFVIIQIHCESNLTKCYGSYLLKQSTVISSRQPIEW